MAYSAIIARVKTKPHPNADRLLLGEVLGCQVIVGIETKNDELGVFFPSDGQLSQEYCEANDLLPVFDSEGKKISGGYFDHKRRVRAQNFRGEKSDGYWAPLNSLSFTGVEVLDFKERDFFCELRGIPICNKYITQATAKQRSGSVNRKKNDLFLKHDDTKQLRHELDKIPDGSIITISEKLHGTSGRMCYVLDEIPKGLFSKAFSKLLSPFLPIKTHDYYHLHGSRNVILSDKRPDEFYRNNFRFTLFDEIKGRLNKGEIVFGEIVGFTETGTEIMSSVGVSKIKDKELRKSVHDIFGEKVSYHYDCFVGKCEFYVYRIININIDGDFVELSVPQMRKRCNEMGLQVAPIIAGPFVYKLKDPFGNDNEFDLLELSNLYVDELRSSFLSDKTLMEGIVLRVDQPNGKTTWLKDKSYVFKVLEGIVKEDESYVDMEEAA